MATWNQQNGSGLLREYLDGGPIMIILIRSNDANPDPRLQKYIDYLERIGRNYLVIAWNRNNIDISKERYVYFNKEAKFGAGIKNIPKKISWFAFIIKKLWEYRKDFSIIHACDLDTALPSFFVGNLLGKKIIFDVFDWISSPSSKSILGRLLWVVENYVFNNSNYKIVCESYRLNQINIKSHHNISILPNIPILKFSNDLIVEEVIKKQREKYSKIYSYVGVFDKNRGIEEFLEVISKYGEYCLNIAGFGNLENLINKYSNFENIVFWGKVDYNKGLNIMEKSDLILAFYYLDNPVHHYAAPNKYYEGLFLGKAILTNKGTLLSNKIAQENTGYIIEEGKDGIKEFISNFKKEEEYYIKNKNSSKVWNEKYREYTNKFMEENYYNMIN